MSQANRQQNELASEIHPLFLAGIAEFVEFFEDRDTYEAIMDAWVKPETRAQKKERIRKLKLDKGKNLIEDRSATCALFF